MGRRRFNATALDAAIAQVAWALTILLAGSVVGMALGEFAVGNSLLPRSTVTGSFAEHSANPDALSPDPVMADDCYGCADSYGVAARMRAGHRSRMSPAFRELGAVEAPDAAPKLEEYRYGGRFDAPLPAERPARIEQVGDAPLFDAAHLREVSERSAN